MNSNQVLLAIFATCVVYVNTTCLSSLLATQAALSAPVCGAALAPGYAPALGLGNPCGLPVAPPAIGCGVCGPKPVSVSISPCLGLITKLKGKLCAKLCGGALNPFGYKYGGGICPPAGGLCPAYPPPLVY